MSEEPREAREARADDGPAKPSFPGDANVLASILLIIGVLACVAAVAILINKYSAHWWAPVLAPLAAAAILILGALLGQRDKPLSHALSLFIDLPVRRPVVGWIAAAVILAVAGVLGFQAQRAVLADDGDYWVQIYEDVNMPGKRVRGMTVVVERRASPRAKPIVLRQTTDDAGSAYFRVSLNDTISVHLERTTAKAGRPMR